MWQMDQLPEWMDLGDGEDFTTPSIPLAEQLKKKMSKPKGAGSVGGTLDGMMDFDSAPMKPAMGAAKGGVKSL